MRLHVGADRGDQAVRLVPEAHGAHVAGQRNAVIRPRRPASALGAIYTAALGAAEAFKYMAQVRPARRVLHRGSWPRTLLGLPSAQTDPLPKPPAAPERRPSSASTAAARRARFPFDDQTPHRVEEPGKIHIASRSAPST